MQTAPTNWNTIFSGQHRVEYKYVINGVDYLEDSIQGIPTITKPLLDEPTIGRVCSATLSLVVRPKPGVVIPKAATVNAYCRLTNESQTTEWVPQGKFYIQSREAKRNITLTCRDAMIKAGQTYLDKTALTFPKSQQIVLNEIAALMGVSIDQRNPVKTGSAYMVEDIADDTLMTEVLAGIAASNGGCFVISDTGQLRLVPFLTHEDTPSQALGFNYKSYTDAGDTKQITRVTMVDFSNNEYTAGNDISTDAKIVASGTTLLCVNDDTETKGRLSGMSSVVNPEAAYIAGSEFRVTNDSSGYEVYVKNPYANQTIVDALGEISYTQGGMYKTKYNPGRCEKMFLDPLLEVGDCVSITDKSYQTRKFRLTAMTVFCNVAYTCTNVVGVTNESDDEYPYETMAELTAKRTVTTDQKYYGNSISRQYGFKSQLDDGGYAIFNADELAFVDKSGKRCLYYDAETETFKVAAVITGRIQDKDGFSFWDLDTGQMRITMGTEIGEDITMRDLVTQVDNAVQTWYQDDDPSLEWSAQEKTARTGDLWYRTTDNTTHRWNGLLWNDQDVPDEVFDKIDGKSSIFVSQPTPPYEVGDLWAQGANGDLFRCTHSRETGSFTQTDWVFACKYTDDTSLNEFISGAYADDKTALQNQIDGKIQSWSQSGDPSLSWTTPEEKQKHVGDLWYRTTDNTTHRWSGSAWAVQNVPDEIFDKIDGKSSIFVSTTPPVPPYEVGDLWAQGANGDLYRCMVTRETGSYVQTDWSLASKYTDDSSLIDFINNTYADDKSELETKIDSKVQTWYQSSDPSLQWTTDVQKEAHIGDLWYNSASDAQTTKRWDWNAVRVQYEWQEQTISKGVLDKIDGKRAIFYGNDTPVNPETNDLWVKDNSGDIYIYVNGGWEFCNDIEIGSRNLVLHSNKDTTPTKYAITCAEYDLSKRLTNGQTYAWSANISYTTGRTSIELYIGNTRVDAKAISGSGTVTLNGTFVANSATTNTTDLKIVSPANSVYVENEGTLCFNTQNVSFSGTTFVATNDAEQTITISGSTLGVQVQVSESECIVNWIQIEEGRVSTSWVLAPEDVEESISISKDSTITELTDYINSIKNGLDGHITDITRADQDYRTESEKRLASIEDSLSDMRADLDGFATTDYTNTHIDTAQSAMELYAQEAVESLKRSLRGSINWENGKLVLGAENSPFKAVLQNDMLGFTDNDTLMAYISNQMLNIRMARIIQAMKLGGYMFNIRQDGGFSISWQGLDEGV